MTGVWVFNACKIGRDAGELAGFDRRTGIAATGDLDEILAARPDCAVRCAMGETRPVERWPTSSGCSARGSTSSDRLPWRCGTRGRCSRRR
ncbi:hypothetical protein E1161_21250 [Saccharopolyspora aridisoli]|uniref:Uncharacterized protein n=1 Tax=Saccharopolyspora aridisoli TaxID=2530385 RepID=A0A4R4UHI5_9PSEU|nr:hypothetical protein E1161_21250 [Saccharopolyspora aridisoli]